MSTVLEHRYRPRGAAQKLFSCREPEVLLDGPAGTGKSRACLEKLHMAALLNPGMNALLARKVAATLSTTAIKTYERHVVSEALRTGDVAFFGGSAREPASYRYSNGSAIVLGGLDKPSKIMSSDYDMIYIPEATELTVDDWEACKTRLRNGVLSFQQLIADCNPGHPKHWLNRRCDEDQTVRLLSRHRDNPLYYTDDGSLTEAGRAYIVGILDRLTGHRYLRLRKGIWAAAEGLVYDGWDDAVHLIDPFPIPEDWPRYWAIDWGFTNPFVLQWWAEDPDGRLYLYREIYMTGRTVDVHAQQALELVTAPHPDRKLDDRLSLLEQIVAGQRVWTEPKPRKIVGDHDAENRARFAKEIGRSITPANKAVEAGLQAVERRLRIAGDGKPRLFIMKGARVEADQSLVEAAEPTCTAEEVTGYIWGKDERPEKKRDHGMDAKRYVVMEREKSGGGVRFV